MKKRYTLYLDESETHKFNPVSGGSKKFHFCMAGVIVAEDSIQDLANSVKQLKRTIWSDFPNPESIILHQMRILEAEKGRLDKNKYPEYAKFTKGAERKKFYEELKQIFVHNDVTIVGSSISEDNLKDFYWVKGKNKQDQYLVAMQLLLENYCHFLCTKDGMGNIIYEYRELIGNEKLRDKYYHMKLMGSMYMAKATAEARLLGLDFVDKNDNIEGLQIADFVPNCFARDHAGIKRCKPNIFGTLKYHRYDGGTGQADRFGVKYMP